MQASLVKRGLPEDATVLQHIDFMLRTFDMDRSLPQWGLVVLPELDLSRHSLTDWLEDQSNLPDDVFVSPFNNMFFAEYNIYLEDFDLSSAESEEKAGEIFREVMNSRTIDFEVPLVIVLNGVAMKYGLKRK